LKLLGARVSALTKKNNNKKYLIGKPYNLN
jgi:hypothetical protein